MENDHVTGNIKDIMADTADQALKNDVPATRLKYGDNNLSLKSSTRRANVRGLRNQIDHNLS